MKSAEIQRFSRLLDFLENSGLTVFNAHRREEWGAAELGPRECTSLDFAELSAADVFVAFPGIPASPGTHVEFGWASALRKPIVVLTEQRNELAFLVQGLPVLTATEFVEFTDDEGFFDRLVLAINSVTAPRPSL